MSNFFNFIIKTKVSPLGLSLHESKKALSLITNFVGRHLKNQKNEPIGKTKHSFDLQKIREPIPTKGTSLESILEILKNEVYINNLNENHPCFFDYIPASPNQISMFSHLISASVNPFVGSWLESSGSTELELQTIDWIRELAGMPTTAGGIFLNGGSESNMQAVRVARKVLLNDDHTKIGKAVVYASDLVNHSLFKP